MQIQANSIDTRVVRPMVTETTALGAAYLAGLATGYWNSLDELKSQWQVDKVFSPIKDQTEIEKVVRDWKKAVERSKNWYSSH